MSTFYGRGSRLVFALWPGLFQRVAHALLPGALPQRPARLPHAVLRVQLLLPTADTSNEGPLPPTAHGLAPRSGLDRARPRRGRDRPDPVRGPGAAPPDLHRGRG